MRLLPTALRTTFPRGALPSKVVDGRRRFEEVVEIAFDDGTRSDVLLPLEDDLVKAAVAKAAALLAPAWEGAAECLPGDGDGLELIECAALIAWPGSQHQTLHADFLRIDEMDDLDDYEDGFVDDEAGNEILLCDGEGCEAVRAERRVARQLG